MEGQYTLRKGKEVAKGVGSLYELEIDDVVVETRSMLPLMAVSFSGMDPSFANGTGGLIGKFPTGELLGRDGITVFEHTGEIVTTHSHTQPVNNAIGLEWQVRDTDHQLFREVREPAWPDKCVFPTETSMEEQRRRLSSTISAEAASKACAETHEEGTDEFELCAMDVIAMDDINAAYCF